MTEASDQFAWNTSDTVKDLIENVYVRYCVAGFQILAIFLAIFGNGYVIYCICRHRRFRKNIAAYLVLNLALCDLFNAAVFQPMSLVDILLPFSHKYRIQNPVYCKTTGFLLSFVQAVTFHTILAISQERLLLICYPFKAKGWLTVQKVKAVLLFIWLSSFCATLPIPMFFAFVETIRLKEANVTICLSLAKDDQLNGQIYYVILFILYFLIPVIVISASYTRIFYTLSRNMHGVQRNDENVRRLMQSRKSLAKMMLAIAGLFALSHGPYFCTFLYISLGGTVEHNPLFAVLMLQFLPLLSSSLNPIIYSIRATKRQGDMLNFLSGADDRLSTRSDVSLKSLNKKKSKPKKSPNGQNKSGNGAGSRNEHWITSPDHEENGTNKVLL